MKAASREFRSAAQTEPNVCSCAPFVRFQAPTATSALRFVAVRAQVLIWALTPSTGFRPRDTRSRLVMTNSCRAGVSGQ